MESSTSSGVFKRILKLFPGWDNDGDPLQPQLLALLAGVVTITTPAVWADVGHELYVIGSAAEFATERADWVMRVLDPPPAGNGRPWGEGVESTEAAEAALYARLGLLPTSAKGI